MVFSLQAGALMLIWIGYGFILRKRFSKQSLQIIDRKKRAAAGAGLFLLAALVLLGGLLAVQAARGVTEEGFEWWAFAAILAIGVVFVYLQVLAAAIMITLIVTPDAPGPSTKVEHDPREP